MAIKPNDLIEKFQYALKNDWGYIWGEAGDVWTAAKQAAATREQTQLYGKRWIGHNVADCSGLFSWAFKQLGGYMYHGSNTMYKSYCTSKGKFSGGKRTDGQELKPGTALFTGTDADHGHVGLFIGNGKVIEAKGTQVGVIESKSTEKKWTYWGELKGVDYSTPPKSEPTPPKANTDGDNQGFPTDSGWHPTLRKGSKGDEVILLQTMLYKLGYGLGVYGIDGDFGRETEKAVKNFQSDHRASDGTVVDGVVGPMTWDALQKSIEQLNSTPAERTYTVCIHGLDKTQADAMKRSYPGCVVTEE